MKYREIVDDIQIQFKSHNESIKTQNPYWILFRVLSEVNAIRDELLHKVTDKSQIPSWMFSMSDPITSALSNSGGIANVFDEYKFAMFTVPDAYYTIPEVETVQLVPLMHQKQIFIESADLVMLRIKSEDESLQDYHYGFQKDDKFFLYPYLNKVYVYYIPRIFCGAYESVVITDESPAPDFIMMEARKRVLESVIIQKQIPEDDRPDQRDIVPQNKQ